MYYGRGWRSEETEEARKRDRVRGESKKRNLSVLRCRVLGSKIIYFVVNWNEDETSARSAHRKGLHGKPIIRHLISMSLLPSFPFRIFHRRLLL